MSKFKTKNVLVRYIWAIISKNLISYFKSATSNLPYCKILQKTKQNKKQKRLNFGPKTPDLGISALQFESDIVIFEISTF